MAILFATGFGLVGWAGLEVGLSIDSILPMVISIGLFSLIFYGAWTLIKGPRFFILSVDAEKIRSGIVGKERIIYLRNIREIYVNDWDGLTVTVVKRDGKRVNFLYIEYVLGWQEHERFIHYLWEFHPDIPVVGAYLGKRYRKKNRGELTPAA